MNIKAWSLGAVLAMTPLAAAVAQAAEVKAVATFTVLADVVKEVGGERVEVTSLVGPNGDPHVFEPTPQDVQALRSADIVFMSGLGLEGWMDRMIAASGYDGEPVVVSEGIEPREMAGGHDHDHGSEAQGHDHGDEGQAHEGHDHGGEGHDHGHGDEGHAHEGHDHGGDEGHHHHDGADPHVWNDPVNVEVWVDNIVAALSQVDPAGADTYRANGEAYREELEQADQWARGQVDSVPADQRKVLTSHDAFGYLGARYGIEFLAPQGITTASEASAQDVARIIEQIRTDNVHSYFFENATSPRLVEQIASATGVRPGGTLYAGALSEPDGPAPTYLQMFHYNIEQLVSGMKGDD
ncbi:metal ABC transporter substrate-binding protein [Kushneria aurantia]|uniref:Metal ABC transporter substrate-binding protein n=1 Tax=Kushneria aurantia TaxID=504092 RepID=A0ABV6G3G0_9GAMM|nr:metal ABC transporter substrate-binding protein [Kushneria aurantia]